MPVTERSTGWTGTELSVRLRRGAGGAVRVDGVLCSAPVWFRWDGATLWLVGSGASPMGDDHVRIAVDVGAGVTVAVRSVAATVVYAATGHGTRWDTEISVADGARLDWRPEPVILTERARHTATTTIRAAASAAVTVDEVLCLGRSGERPGAMRSTLDVGVDGAPIVLTSFDTAAPGWSGPAGVDGRTVVGTRLRLGPDVPAESGRTGSGVGTCAAAATVLRPAEGCRLGVVAADDLAAARVAMDTIVPG